MFMPGGNSPDCMADKGNHFGSAIAARALRERCLAAMRVKAMPHVVPTHSKT
jgi:hypothetical protein